jgi:hypothetical protein
MTLELLQVIVMTCQLGGAASISAIEENKQKCQKFYITCVERKAGLEADRLKNCMIEKSKLATSNGASE